MLEAIKDPFELDDIEALILAREIDFDLLRDLRMRQDPFVGCLRLVVAPCDLAPVPLESERSSRYLLAGGNAPSLRRGIHRCPAAVPPVSADFHRSPRKGDHRPW